jgi:hypothetical protein
MVGTVGAGQDPSGHHRPNAPCASEGLEGETVRLSLSEQGLIYRVFSPEEFGRFIESEIARWAIFIKGNRIVVSE